MIDEHTTHLKGLNDFGKPVNALQGIEVKTEKELRIVQHTSGTQLMLGENNQFTQARDELQGLGCHIGSDDHGIFPQAAQHMAQSQGRAQSIAVGRLVARDNNALHAVDKGSQPIDGMFINYCPDHRFKSQ